MLEKYQREDSNIFTNFKPEVYTVWNFDHASRLAGGLQCPILCRARCNPARRRWGVGGERLFSLESRTSFHDGTRLEGAFKWPGWPLETIPSWNSLGGFQDSMMES